MTEIATAVNATKGAEFELVFDPTLVRGMSYYTGTIFQISMPELGAACGGGGRYDKMIGKFTGNDVPACGFSIGFENHPASHGERLQDPGESKEGSLPCGEKVSGR